MEHVLIYPVQKGYLDRDLIKDVVLAAESEGFHSVLFWDHYLLPAGPDTLDAWSILGYLSGLTSSIKLGTVVTPIPFRPPIQLAKIVTSVDVLSNGRTILGVGAGWHRPEFDAFSQWRSPAERVDFTAEALDMMTKLWKGDKIDIQGKFHNFLGAQIVPSPVQKPHPPLWFGVRGRRMLGLAARFGDAWIPTNITPADYSQGLRYLRSIQNDIGVDLEIKGALQNFDVFTDAAACRDAVKKYSDAGCQYYGSVWSYPREEMVSRVSWFANNVME